VVHVRVWPPHTSERRGGGGGCERDPCTPCKGSNAGKTKGRFVPESKRIDLGANEEDDDDEDEDEVAGPDAQVALHVYVRACSCACLCV
jgi:hypothetical protein